MRALAPLGILALALMGCNPAADPHAVQGEDLPKHVPSDPPVAKLVKVDSVAGKGAPVKAGDTVYVLYRGTLPNGREFDSNYAPDRDVFRTVVGAGQVIKGWDEGLIGMRQGGTRQLKVPWSMAYGEEGTPTIAPKQDLNFEIKLLYVLRPGEEAKYDAVDVKKGSGPAVKTGDTVSVHYVGTFLNDKKFDSSRDRGQPFEFTVGQKQVIPGWEDGVLGMQVGGVRRLVLPPLLAYGEAGNASIPGGSVLKFEIELLEIKKN